MEPTDKLIVAFCLNDPQSAVDLSSKITTDSNTFHYIFCHSFDAFIRDISKLPRIDVFVVEECFEQCSSYDFIKKIKESKKYKKSVTALMVDSVPLVSVAAKSIKSDFILDWSSFNKKMGDHFQKKIAEKHKTIIPEEFSVLVLDDQPEILDIISMHLDQMNHSNYQTCLSLSEARQLMTTNHYDLLLLDWNLADGTCLDLLEFCKSNELAKEMGNDKSTAIVITGRDDVDDIITLLRYGVSEHIIKPFDFDEFEDKIIYALEKRSS